ncbi:MAG TPA: TetR family transcriptional regulator C-terminal domain-containing protein [Gammaproteobacteria bacterium]|nr:TetR family transcriptional regulator C-terminal domain-containing protein [Gammaproteobacteria bacterium]
MQKRAERTRNELVETMRRLIHKRGVGRASLREVLAATGANKGSLYFHFGGKDELVLAALEQAAADFEAFVDERLAGPTPAARLRAFLAAIRDMHRESDFARGCLFGNTALEMADADPRYRRLLNGVFERWGERLRPVIAAAQECGELRRDVGAPVLARQVVAVVEGGVMQARLQRREAPLAEALATLEVLLGMAPAAATATEDAANG